MLTEKEINWKNIDIWQPCSGETGNPLGRWVAKMSSIDFSRLNRGFYQFWYLYHQFYGNKLKKILLSGNSVMQNLATLFVVGLWKYHQLISRAKKPTICEKFVKILDILCASYFETIFGHFLITNGPFGENWQQKFCQFSWVLVFSSFFSFFERKTR